jgi:hypothetical protein
MAKDEFKNLGFDEEGGGDKPEKILGGSTSTAR